MEPLEMLLGPDLVATEAARVLDRLEAGAPRSEWLESAVVDLEPGRRRHGEVLEGQRHNDEAASYLTGEAVCMANSAGGVCWSSGLPTNIG